MSIEANKLVARRFVEEFWNQGRMEAADELIAPGCMAWKQPVGPEGFKHVFAAVTRAFPDLHFSIEDLFAADDKVVMRVIESGTHQGEWTGISPTGKQFSVPGIAIFHVVDGQIVQQWFNNDSRLVAEQLGARIESGDTNTNA